MCTYEEFYAFLREYYLHSRFEERNTKEWGTDSNGVPNYSQHLAQSRYEELQKHGKGLIGMYESRLGRVIKYDADLNITNPDEPPAQIQRRAGHLTHLF